MKILLASSELFPYSKTGGLADMVGALGKALAADGHSVRTITPLYRGIREKHPDIRETTLALTAQLGTRLVPAKVWRVDAGPHHTVYLVDQPEFFDRPNLYGEKCHDYPYNAARFIFFSKAVAHLARALSDSPEVV